MRFLITVRPANDTDEVLALAMRLGFEAFRVNYGRSSADANRSLIRRLKSHSRMEIFVDLPGTKCRLGSIEGRTAVVDVGQVLTFDLATSTDIERGVNDVLSVNRPLDLSPAEVGDTVMMCDGRVSLRVERKKGGLLRCVVEKGGTIYNACGIVVPSRYQPRHSITSDERAIMDDLVDLADYFCVSFADSPSVMEDARRYLKRGSCSKLIAKIETPAGLHCSEALFSVAQGVMFGRGDLSNFLGPYEMTNAAAELSRLHRMKGKLLLFATDYFKSMASGGDLSDTDLGVIRAAAASNVDYLVINETSSSRHWRQILYPPATLPSRKSYHLSSDKN